MIPMVVSVGVTSVSPATGAMAAVRRMHMSSTKGRFSVGYFIKSHPASVNLEK
jgi:hypothetical protein